MATPTPMPAFAPPLRPLDELWAVFAGLNTAGSVAEGDVVEVGFVEAGVTLDPLAAIVLSVRLKFTLLALTLSEPVT